MEFIYLVLAGMACFGFIFATAFSFAFGLIVLAMLIPGETIDALYLKKIERNYGVFASYAHRRLLYAPEKTTYQAFIVERDGKRLLAVKQHVRAIVGYSYEYLLFDLDSLEAFGDQIEEALLAMDRAADPFETFEMGMTDPIFMGNALKVWKDVCMADNVRGLLGVRVPSTITLAAIRRFPSVVATRRSRDGESVQDAPHLVIKRFMRKAFFVSISYFYLDREGVQALLAILRDALQYSPGSAGSASA